MDGRQWFAFLFFDALFATSWVCGLQSIVFGFLPLRFADTHAGPPGRGASELEQVHEQVHEQVGG